MTSTLRSHRRFFAVVAVLARMGTTCATGEPSSIGCVFAAVRL